MAHDTHSHHHHHTHNSATGYWPIVLTLGFAVVEAVGGWLSGSLALLGDAGHMVSDALSLGLAWFAAWVGSRPPSRRYTYGFARAEIIAALVNGVAMLLVGTVIVVEAVQRLQVPQPVQGGQVMLIALLGLLVNILVAWQLGKQERNLNTRAALLHVMGDLLGSVAALLAGVIIYFTGWTRIDPLLSMFIVALILYSTFNLLREALRVLMEGVPLGFELEAVAHEMAAQKDVVSVHDVHVWTLSSGSVALSAHVVMHDLAIWSQVLAGLRHVLHEHYDIDHVTLQPELAVVEGIVTWHKNRAAG
jgi:cobalt-zinc-cadmium efflux system protein